MRVFDQVDPQRVERRELQLTILSLTVNAILAAGAALLMYPTISAHPVIFGELTSRVFFFGFCILSVLLVGYLFDRKIGGPRLTDCFIRVMPKDSSEKLKILYSDIAGIAFTGRDTAAGKSFAAWVKKYNEKKAAGEKNIGIDAEPLD